MFDRQRHFIRIEFNFNSEEQKATTVINHNFCA